MNEAPLISANEPRESSRESQLRGLGPLLSFTVPFLRQSWPIATVRLLAGMAALSASGFLLAQFATTASAGKPLAFCALALFVAGMALLARTPLPLLGALTVDSRGVRLTPWPLGFRCDWNELASWQANLIRCHDSGFPAAEFRRRDARGPYVFPQAWISERDLAELVRVMRSLAPDLERRPLGGDDPLGYSRFRRSVKPV